MIFNKADCNVRFCYTQDSVFIEAQIVLDCKLNALRAQKFLHIRDALVFYTYIPGFKECLWQNHFAVFKIQTNERERIAPERDL
jgi:hypothetical protein